jgi:hypothetical protein
MMQRRKQEKEEELIRAFGGDLGSCQTRKESSLQREQREATAERQAEESVRGAEQLLEEDARVREEERKGVAVPTLNATVKQGMHPLPVCLLLGEGW